MERFVDLFRKTDDLHLSDFREMRLISKWDFDIAYSAVTGISLDAYLRKFIVWGFVYNFGGLAVPILWQTNHISDT